MPTPSNSTPDPPSNPLMHMEGVCKSFGVTRALHNVSFEVQRGHILALIGENGAGKSTLMKILNGVIPSDSGKMMLEGNVYQPRGPLDARANSVAMIFQELNLAPDLSVEDNIMLGQEVHRFGLLNRRQQKEKVRKALAWLGHEDIDPDCLVESLPVGAKQIVGIARALVMDAKLIVFDEPTSSLTEQDVQQLFRVIRRLKEQNIGVIYISHFLEEIRQVCDCYTVLRDGEVAGSGDLKEVTEDEIVTLMVGRSVSELFPNVEHEIGETLLTVDNISRDAKPKEVSLELRRGEILGIAGLVGAGRTEFLRAIYSLDPITEGSISVTGLSRLPQSPRGRIRHGFGFVSEDRKTEGLAQEMSIADNMTYSRLTPYSRLGWLNLPKRAKSVEHWMERVEVKAASQEAPVSTLSGGNQQKVAIARVLHQDAQLFLLDEPTRGIDVGTKSEIYRMIGELARDGKAVIFVSSYLPELMAVCDRIGVMARGRLTDIRDTSDWTEEEILASCDQCSRRQ